MPHTDPHSYPLPSPAQRPSMPDGFPTRRTTLSRVPRWAVLTLMSAALLQGCNRSSNDQPAPVPVASGALPAAPAVPVSAPLAPAYQRLNADQLYQMVAPIALFPDRLLAQVLAGATHPDQIAAASAWRAQQSGDLASVQNAADQQPWDVSVKALTAFPDVLAQMAKNLEWTTALGQAYANDSTDVMNAIQALRQRASSSGHLKSSPEWKVSSAPYTAPAEGGGVVPPPGQLIEIDPAQSDMVYVPRYDPTVVYGDALPIYPGYQVVDTGPVYRNPNDPLVTGLLAFGAGVAIASVLDHHPWGWNAWGMNWNNHGHDHPPVEYNHNPYAPGQNGRDGGRGAPGREAEAPGFTQRPANGGGVPPREEQSSRPGNEHGMSVPQFRAQDTQPSAGPGTPENRGETLRPAIQDFRHDHPDENRGEARGGTAPANPSARPEENRGAAPATPGRPEGRRDGPGDSGRNEENRGAVQTAPSRPSENHGEVPVAPAHEAAAQRSEVEPMVRNEPPIRAQPSEQARPDLPRQEVAPSRPAQEVERPSPQAPAARAPSPEAPARPAEHTAPAPSHPSGGGRENAGGHDGGGHEGGGNQERH